MNPAYFIGLILCVILCILGIAFDSAAQSIAFDNLANFINVPGLLIVVGGTMATLAATFPLEQTARMFKHMPIILGLRKHDPVSYIAVITDLSVEARKNGLLALEAAVGEYTDTFLRDSVMLIVDATEPDKVRRRLENELGNIEARHSQSWDLYDKAAALAPGFGMIGTIIGLINMLRAMNFEDEGGAAKLTAGMAVALISALYGVLLANLVFIPLGTQLRAQHAAEMLCKEIVIEGVISIQAGENPRQINDKLMSFLTRSQRGQAEANMDSAE